VTISQKCALFAETEILAPFEQVRKKGEEEKA